MSMEEYNKIQTGMTYKKVVEITGGEGTELSSNEIGGYKTIIYKWDGEGSIGANANIIFQNDAVMSKAQYGLK